MSSSVSNAVIANRDQSYTETDDTINSRPDMKFDLADYWRMRFLRQEAHVSMLKSANDEKSRVIAGLESKNANLETALRDVVISGKNVLATFNATNEQLDEANRRAKLLKKSNREKGNVEQRNLALKAYMRSHQCRGTENSKEQTLLEALALAKQRIQDLEVAGTKLLDALDCSSDDEEGKSDSDENDRCGLAEAELVFRGVIEDEMYEEQKLLWEELLDEFSD